MCSTPGGAKKSGLKSKLRCRFSPAEDGRVLLCLLSLNSYFLFKLLTFDGLRSRTILQINICSLLHLSS